MKPTPEQIEALARLIVDTRPQEITCDELLDLVDHLRLCPECSEELEALRRALREA